MSSSLKSRAAGCLVRALACAGVACAVATGARAQSDDVVDAQVGRFSVFPADGSPGCTLVLQRDKTIGGRVAKASPECLMHVPALADATAWFFRDGIALIDATRHVVISFEEAEGFVLSSPSVAQPKYFLVPAVAGVTHVPRPAEVQGVWRLDKGVGAACTLHLEAGSESGDAWRALRIEPGCSLGGLARKMTRWRVAATEIEIEAGEDVIGFAQTGAAQFRADRGGFRLARGKP